MVAVCAQTTWFTVANAQPVMRALRAGLTHYEYLSSPGSVMQNITITARVPSLPVRSWGWLVCILWGKGHSLRGAGGIRVAGIAVQTSIPIPALLCDT